MAGQALFQVVGRVSRSSSHCTFWWWKFAQDPGALHRLRWVRPDSSLGLHQSSGALPALLFQCCFPSILPARFSPSSSHPSEVNLNCPAGASDSPKSPPTPRHQHCHRQHPRPPHPRGFSSFSLHLHRRIIHGLSVCHHSIASTRPVSPTS